MVSKVCLLKQDFNPSLIYCFFIKHTKKEQSATIIANCSLFWLACLLFVHHTVYARYAQA